MLFRNRFLLSVSPYALFYREMKEAGKLNGSKNPAKYASTLFKQLKPKEKEALASRTQALNFASSEAYKSVMKKQQSALKNLTLSQRYQIVSSMQSALKKEMAIAGRSAPVNKMPTPTPSKAVEKATKPIHVRSLERPKKGKGAASPASLPLPAIAPPTVLQKATVTPPTPAPRKVFFKPVTKKGTLSHPTRKWKFAAIPKKSPVGNQKITKVKHPKKSVAMISSKMKPLSGASRQTKKEKAIASRPAKEVPLSKELTSESSSAKKGAPKEKKAIGPQKSLTFVGTKKENGSKGGNAKKMVRKSSKKLTLRRPGKAGVNASKKDKSIPTGFLSKPLAAPSKIIPR